MTGKSKNQIDMTEGSILKKIIAFSIPLILTNMLQLCYHAADMIIVGQFAGSQALSAVGSSTALVNVIIGCFMGLSMGAGVSVSRYYGAKNPEGISRTLHTAIVAAVICSFLVATIGIIATRPLLIIMQSPPDVIDGATLYMRIFFLGMPFNLLYNFGAAMLRAVGDTKRPLIFLAFAGVINVLFNLFFVIVLGMGVAGVAFATIISQAVAAFLVIRCFIVDNEVLRLNPKVLKLHKYELIDIIKIGLPAGVQGSLFSLSNATVQSAINTFGSSVVAGNVAASNIEGFVYVSANSISQATLTASGQNIGAKKYQRARMCLTNSLVVVVVISCFLSLLINIFAEPLLALYNTDPQIIAVGITKIRITTSLYAIFGIVDVLVGQLRGMGASLMPTVVSLCGICLIRILWVAVVFPQTQTLESIYWVYPISWVVTVIGHWIMYFIMSKKIPKQDCN